LKLTRIFHCRLPVFFCRNFCAWNGLGRLIGVRCHDARQLARDERRPLLCAIARFEAFDCAAWDHPMGENTALTRISDRLALFCARSPIGCVETPRTRVR